MKARRIVGSEDWRGERFRCRGCKRDVPWDQGADDDMPDHCDDCWRKAQGARLRGAS